MGVGNWLTVRVRQVIPNIFFECKISNPNRSWHGYGPLLMAMSKLNLLLMKTKFTTLPSQNARPMGSRQLVVTVQVKFDFMCSKFILKFSEDVRSTTFGAFDNNLRGSKATIATCLEWYGSELHCNFGHGCH